MKTKEIQTKKTATQKSKVRKVSEAEKIARKNAYLNSSLYKDVNFVNAQVKECTKQFNGVRTMLLALSDDKLVKLGINSNHKLILRTSKKHDTLYKYIVNNLKPYKQTGKVSFHKVLLFLNNKEHNQAMNDIIKNVSK